MSYYKYSKCRIGIVGYFMCRKARKGKRGGGMILHIKKTLRMFVLQLGNNATQQVNVVYSGFS